MSAHPHRWLGLDSSLTTFGWAVLEVDGPGVAPRFVDAGLLRTAKDHEAESKTGDTTRRVHDIGLEVQGLVDRFSPMLAGIESLALPWGKCSMVTVSTLGRVRGIVDGVCLVRGLRLVEVAPQALKHYVTGDRNAEKEQVMETLCNRFAGLRARLEELPKGVRDNPADACAVALWAHRFVADMLVAGVL